MKQTSLFNTLGGIFQPPGEFFNSIGIEGKELSDAKKHNDLQDQRVLSLFRELGKMTPLQCAREYDKRYPAAPFTSVRRSITCLTKRDLLVKLDEKRNEVYGKVNHLWQAV